MDLADLHVLRVTSVFEPWDGAPGAGSVRFDPVGGMQTHTGELTRALDSLGVTQTVVTTRPPGAPRTTAFAARTTVVRLGLPISRFRQFYAVPAARLVPRLAACADLVHAHLGEDIAVVPLALAAVRRHGLPLVLTVHCSVRYTLAVHDVRSAALKTVGGWCEQRGEQRADRIIALSPRLAGILTTHGVPADRVRVIPSGVRPALFAAPGRADPLAGLPRPRVVFLGRLHEQKNVDLLLHAAARLRHPAHVVIAGDGPERQHLEELHRRLGLAGRVTFLGFVDHEAVPALLRGADMLVMPSRYEELGTAMVEAMWSGVPVVATRTGGIPDLVQDGVSGRLVEPGDVDGLTRAVDDLLADPDLRRRLGERGRHRTADFRWDRLALRVLDVYRSALATTRRSSPRHGGAPQM
jgi:glycosyltransferase involved in cell wall biosynthesis